MKSISVETKSRTEFVDITSLIENQVKQAGVSSGIVTVFVPHTTAGVTIND